MQDARQRNEAPRNATMTKPALDALFREATGFHKTTCTLASRFSGVRDFDHEHHQPIPMLVRAVDGTFFRTRLNDHRADADWMQDADSYFTSLVVSGAFSLELHLKHLHGLVEQQERRGHDLHGLFLELSDWTRKKLEDIFQAISGSQPIIRQQFEALKEKSGITIDWTLHDVLKESARAFETWRYSYESKTVQSSFVGYGEAVFAMRIISTQFKGKTP
jgi:hypothetical protein